MRIKEKIQICSFAILHAISIYLLVKGADTLTQFLFSTSAFESSYTVTLPQHVDLSNGVPESESEYESDDEFEELPTDAEVFRGQAFLIVCLILFVATVVEDIFFN